MTDSNSSVDISSHDYRKKRKSIRKSKSKSDSCLTDNDYYTTPKNIQMSDEMLEKLSDLPDVIRYIEKLQKMIQKQVKKIIKWKMKAKGKAERVCKNTTTQTCDMIEFQRTEDNSKKVVEATSLVDDIREAAEQAVQSSGFVYEATSGLYYDYNSGYYYNAEYGLYYDGTTGTYLKYNQDTKSYEYHSQITVENNSLKDSVKKRKPKYNRKEKGMKRTRHEEDDLEEGEYTDTSSSAEDDCVSSESSDISKQWPPCVRLIVETTDIPKIRIGSLFIITCDGGTIGREGDHAVHLPDINVSKHHLKITFDGAKYTVTDLGSRNGTILNGKRMSPSKQESDPQEITHGSKLQLGSTTILCHIHEGSQTCGNCEPGLLIEEEKDDIMTQNMNKSNKNQQYKQELRKLKKQHGFLGNEDCGKIASGYTDRAQKRRETVGSQNPYEKTQAASLDQSIPSENKGFKLLSKMGWKEGQSLGKDGNGTLEPVKLSSNTGTTGLDAQPLPTLMGNEGKQNIWKKAQERFDKLSTAIYEDVEH
ncbi:angiogenic factor with G patch and FHA domains 1 isoform X1 [Rhynchophorus ferrugineus]|uniref:angiogenic factor with G patch and FHA domains 1 isoform X1 n=1 Tax=Rhynchophorus ferrugineus TaxID=354439 RepID=UPI003FCDF70C